MIRKILKSIFLISLIMVLSYVCYAKYIRKDAVIKLGGYGFLIVVTNSMEPEICPNTLVMIKECKAYDVNDIVTYLDLHEMLITHRICQIGEESFVAKGDNNSVFDKRMSISQIQGKVVFQSSFLGNFIFYDLKFVMMSCFLILIILAIKTKLTKEAKNEVKQE